MYIYGTNLLRLDQPFKLGKKSQNARTRPGIAHTSSWKKVHVVYEIPGIVHTELEESTCSVRNTGDYSYIDLKESTVYVIKVDA
jgi:hypothetical protein